MLNCIRQQTNQNYRLIISVDDELSYQYVKEAGIADSDIVRVSKYSLADIPDHKERKAPYNLYFNNLLERVEDGLVFCIDDDDTLVDNKILQHIADTCTDINTLYIHKILINGRELPSKSWGVKPTIHDIGVPNFVVHSSHAKKVKWGAYYGSDGEYVIKLHNMLSNTVWIPKIIYVAQASDGKPEL
jgi:hypothetical protein